VTDLDRYLAFVRGADLPHEVHESPDVLLLPIQPEESIAFTRYKTRVWMDMLEVCFADDGHLVSLARPEPRPHEVCDSWDPEPHAQTGLVICRNCRSGPASSHAA
jgi:hypothetical protein